jgi:hypothetical protein
MSPEGASRLAETIRLHPVFSLVRHSSEPLTYEHKGRRWRIPAGGYVGYCRTWSSGIRTGSTGPTSTTRTGASDAARAASFGRGALGCVAT